MRMKKVLLLLIILLLNGCAKTPELKYDNDREIYVCSKEDIDLLKTDVNVLIKKNQGFFVVDDKGEWQEKIDYKKDIKLEYREKDEEEKNISACYFINYDNMKHEFGSLAPISFRDKELGNIRFHVKGEYEYTIYNMDKYYELVLNTEDVDKSIENIYRKINVEIVASYILNMNTKTFAEMQREEKINDVMLERVNRAVKELYGIEVKQIKIHEVVRK